MTPACSRRRNRRQHGAGDDAPEAVPGGDQAGARGAVREEESPATAVAQGERARQCQEDDEQDREHAVLIAPAPEHDQRDVGRDKGERARDRERVAQRRLVLGERIDGREEDEREPDERARRLRYAAGLPLEPQAAEPPRLAAGR